MFDLARKNYFETLKKLDVNIKWKVEFHLYDDLQLDDHAKIKVGMTPLKSLVLILDLENCCVRMSFRSQIQNTFDFGYFL